MSRCRTPTSFTNSASAMESPRAETILVAHEGIELPFDIRNQRTLFYSLSLEGIARARTALVTH